MRIPRNISGKELIKSLEKIGYENYSSKRKSYSKTSKFPEEHHLTIPNHEPIKIGTLSSIPGEIAKYRNLKKEDLVNQLFG